MQTFIKWLFEWYRLKHKVSYQNWTTSYYYYYYCFCYFACKNSVMTSILFHVTSLVTIMWHCVCHERHQHRLPAADYYTNEYYLSYKMQFSSATVTRTQTNILHANTPISYLNRSSRLFQVCYFCCPQQYYQPEKRRGNIVVNPFFHRALQLLEKQYVFCCFLHSFIAYDQNSRYYCQCHFIEKQKIGNRFYRAKQPC